MFLAPTMRVTPGPRRSLQVAQESDRACAPLAGVAVLVVEDDVAVRRVAAVALQAWGGIVVEVGSAQEALQMFDVVLPAIVLTDLGLPDLDGAWLLRQIRRRPPEKGGRVPVVAVSAYFQPRERELIRAAGFQDLVSKPIAPYELCLVIARQLS